MIKEAIGTGTTVESAIEAGVAKLGVPREMVEVQVLAMPKKAFLGMFGGNPAKVRVYMEVPDELPAAKEEPKKTERPSPP